MAGQLVAYVQLQYVRKFRCNHKCVVARLLLDFRPVVTQKTQCAGRQDGYRERDQDRLQEQRQFRAPDRRHVYWPSYRADDARMSRFCQGKVLVSADRRDGKRNGQAL